MENKTDMPKKVILEETENDVNKSTELQKALELINRANKITRASMENKKGEVNDEIQDAFELINRANKIIKASKENKKGDVVEKTDEINNCDVNESTKIEKALKLMVEDATHRENEIIKASNEIKKGDVVEKNDVINDSDVIEKHEIKKVLTYTSNYRAKLQDIQINKNYNIEETLKYGEDYSKYFPNNIKQFYFKWNPEGGETTFDLNKNINIIDYNYIAKCEYDRHIITMCIIDNYGNIYESNKMSSEHCGNDGFKFDSIILKNKEQEILSDQVIDFIIDNNIIRKKNLSSDEIKKIQEIAGMGQEQTIKYVINRPQEIIEVKYDKNDILKDLLLSFPGCDPWDKSKELIEKYTTRLSILLSSLDHDEDLFDELVYEKNNIKKMISRNIDIDDDDIQQLIENKKKILNRINNKINEIMDRSEDKNDEIEKLKVLLCKLENIPQKKMTTEFISTIE